MNRPKEEVLKELNTLRDELVGISRMEDEVEADKRAIYEQKSKIDSYNREYNEYEENYKELCEVHNELVSFYENEQSDFNNKLKKRLKIEFVGNSLIIAAIISLAVVVVLCFLFGFILLLGLIVPVALIVVYFIKRVTKTDEIKDELNESLQKCVDKINIAKSTIVEVENKMPILMKERDDNIAQCNGAIRRMEWNISTLKSKAEKCREKLERQYGAILDPADWRMIDYIIFCIRSGRADTIKDSLPFADDKRMSDDIISAVHEKADDIVRRIGAAGLDSEKCFDKLNIHIDKLSNLIKNQHGETIAALAILSKQSSALYDAMQVNTDSNVQRNSTEKGIKSEIEKLRAKL